MGKKKLPIAVEAQAEPQSPVFMRTAQGTSTQDAPAAEAADPAPHGNTIPVITELAHDAAGTIFTLLCWGERCRQSCI